MVITISVMASLTYPNLSLHSHRVITVLRDLQIFPCATNMRVTCVHRNKMPNTRTSCVMMTFIVVLQWLEAVEPEVVSSVNSLIGENPPP
jgi:hypothetical protein